MMLSASLLPPGAIIWTHYRIRQYLSSGGMADTYVVEDRQGQIYVAKVLKEAFSQHPAYVERLQQEGFLHSQLQHPNIVRCYGFFQQEYTGLLLEYVDGRPIQTAHDAQWDYGNLRALLEDVSSALDYIHSQGICHCDIKPGNILYDNIRGIYRLIDFGIAVPVRHIVPGGTAYYMSPEQIRKEPITPAADIYSLGVMLYEFIVGDKPFTDRRYDDESDATSYNMAQADDIYEMHINVMPPRPSSLNADIQPPVDEVLLKALDKTPHQRYRTARQVLEALDGAMARSSKGAYQADRWSMHMLPSATLMCTRGIYLEQSNEIDRPEILIGRSQECHIKLPDRDISRRHAIIRWDRGKNRYIVEDQRSQRGTRVNSHYLREPHILRHNDLISVGNHNFLFMEDEIHAVGNTTTAPSPDNPSLMPLNLITLATAILNLLLFVLLPWYGSGRRTGNLLNLVLEAPVTAGTTGVLVGVVIVLCGLVFLLIAGIRLAKLNLYDLAGQSRAISVPLMLFGLRDKNMIASTGRLGLLVGGVNCVAVLMIASLTDELSGTTAAVAVAVSLLWIILMSLSFGPVWQVMSFVNLSLQRDAPVLQIFSGPVQGGRITVKGTQFTIGRHSRNDLVLFGDKTASRDHAVIVFDSGGYIIRAVKINPVLAGPDANRPQPYTQYRLSHGDYVRIGETLMRFMWR